LNLVTNGQTDKIDHRSKASRNFSKVNIFHRAARNADAV